MPRRKATPPEGAAGYILSGILAGAYARGRHGGADLGTTLAHAIWVDAQGEWLGEKSVCNRVKLDLMADSEDGELCPTCADRVHRSGLPRKD